jgi:hypothetical protein
LLCGEEAARECEFVVETGDGVLHRRVDLSAQFVLFKTVLFECLLVRLVFDEGKHGQSLAQVVANHWLLQAFRVSLQLHLFLLLLDSC